MKMNQRALLVSLIVGVVAFCLLGAPAMAAEYPAVRGAVAMDMDGSQDVALVVAVEDYLLLPAVPGARETAEDWVSYFRDGLGVQRVYDIVDQEVTRETLSRFATQAAQDVGEGGTLWFVFVGHGAPSADGSDGILVGMDAQQNIDSLMARGMPQGELMSVLEGGAQERTVAFIDACFSGRDGAGETIVPGLQPVLPVSHRPRTNAQTVVLSAAESDQFAGGLPGAERPAFSYWMLGAMRGWAAADGEVTASQALEFTRQKLRAVSDRVQTPSGHGALDVVLVRGVEEIDPLPGWNGRIPTSARDRIEEEQPRLSRPTLDRVPRSVREGDDALRAIPSSLGARQELFEDQQLFSRSEKSGLRSQHEFYRGSWGNHLPGPEFYRALGRDDLAAQYRPSRTGLAWAVAVGLPVVAGVLGGVLGSMIVSDPGFPGTEPSSLALPGALGGVAVGATIGIPMGIFWLGREKHPVDQSRRLLMMREHNEELQQRLRLE